MIKTPVLYLLPWDADFSKHAASVAGCGECHGHGTISARPCIVCLAREYEDALVDYHEKAQPLVDLWRQMPDGSLKNNFRMFIHEYLKRTEDAPLALRPFMIPKWED